MKNNKEKKGISSNLLLIIAIPILVAVGVLAGSYITGSNTPAVSGNEIEETVPETTVALDDFLLNLEPTSTGRNYIRLEVSLSSTQEGGAEKITTNLDKIRDSIIHTVSRLTVEDVYNEEAGTTRLKEVLKKSLNELFEDSTIHEVYITNIVVQ